MVTPGALALRAAHRRALNGRVQGPATRCEGRHWRCKPLDPVDVSEGFQGSAASSVPYTTFPHSVTLGH